MTGGMAVECKRYYSRLAELVATKGKSYATTMSCISARVSFALLRSALVCLRGSRASRRVHWELSDIDLDIEKGQYRYFVLFSSIFGKFLPPQGFGREVKTRGCTLEFPTC